MILSLMSCIINTVIVVLMTYKIYAFEHPIHFLWLLIVVPSLVGQWILSVRHYVRKRK